MSGNMIDFKFYDKRLKVNSQHNPFRKNSKPRFCFELIKRRNGDMTIREFMVTEGTSDRYLCEMIGRGVVIAQDWPTWDNPNSEMKDEDGFNFNLKSPNAYDFLEAFFKAGGQFDDLKNQIDDIAKGMGQGGEQNEDELESDFKILQRLIKPASGYEMGEIIESEFDILPEEWPRIVGLAKIRENILLVGPSGCGKTHIAKRLSDEMELPFGSVSCTAGMSEEHMSGWLIPIGDNMRMEHVSTPFIECYENGGVFLFDELDAADENTLVFVNSALANDYFSIPQRYKNPTVQKHKDFICLAAANTYGHGGSIEYSARNQLDAATLDRFGAGLVTMDYSRKVEEMLVAPIVLAWGRRVRDSIRKHKIKRFLSTRRLLRFTLQAQKLGWGRDSWEYSFFQDWSKQDKMKLVNDGVIKSNIKSEYE